MSLSRKDCCLRPTKWKDQNAPLCNIHNQVRLTDVLSTYLITSQP